MIGQEEKFRFDLEGYLVVKNALTPEEVAEMNRIADKMYTEDYDEKCMRSRQDVSQWGPLFQSLIDHPVHYRVLPRLRDGTTSSKPESQNARKPEDQKTRKPDDQITFPLDLSCIMDLAS